MVGALLEPFGWAWTGSLQVVPERRKGCFCGSESRLSAASSGNTVKVFWAGNAGSGGHSPVS